MDISSLMGGDAPEAKQKPAIEYGARLTSPVANGEVKLTIGENALTATALFDAAEIPFADINAIRFADYVVSVETDDGLYEFSRMGQWASSFYDALRGAYNEAALRSLFVEGKPVATADGEYRYFENGTPVNGRAPLRVYENCIAVLPPDLNARRMPLRFVDGMQKGAFSLSFTLGGESYTFSKLGYDAVPFAEAAEKQIRKLREKALASVRELDPSLTATQASRLAGLVPEGAAAPMGELAFIAPSFLTALESKIADTHAADGYQTFKRLCDPARIYIGFKKNKSAGETARSPLGVLGGNNPLAPLEEPLGNVAETNAKEPDPYLFWLIAPSPDGRYAAVEFSEDDSATFIYRAGGDFDNFARKLNLALEAISFRREAIRLSDAELRKPENADYYMAAKRTAALRFVRNNFAGRVIHSGPELWKKKLLEIWGAL